MRRTLGFLIGVLLAAACASNELDSAGRTQSTIVSPPDIVSPSGSDGTSPPIRTTPFVWGANGHPLTQSPYAGPLDNQLNDLKRTGARWYRVDVNPPAGSPPAYNDLRLASLIARASALGIQLLPCVIAIPDRPPIAGHDYYADGYALGTAFGDVLAAHPEMAHVELANELDNYAIYVDAAGNAPDGLSINDFGAGRLAAATSLLRGLSTGIHDRAPSVKRIIDVNWRHLGLLDALARDEVPYDIVGYHWYSSMGSMDAPIEDGSSILSRLDAYGRDVWVTESDRIAGSLNESSGDNQVQWIYKFGHSARFSGWVRANEISR